MLTLKDRVEAVVTGLLAAVFLTLSVHYIVDYLDRPDVHFSNSTGECVRVLNYSPDDRYTCDDIPESYNHVWVQ
mgnify:CR=1 FL=1|jgi:hypothetical protein